MLTCERLVHWMVVSMRITETQQRWFDADKAGLGNVAYGEAACGAYQKGAAANAYMMMVELQVLILMMR